MRGLGNGENGELTFLDTLAIISFAVGLQNLEMNITQEDMDETSRKLAEALKQQIDDIHNHLSVQDAKLNIILEALRTQEESR